MLKKLPQWHNWRPDYYVIGRCGIQYSEVDKIKEKQNTG